MLKALFPSVGTGDEPTESTPLYGMMNTNKASVFHDYTQDMDSKMPHMPRKRRSSVAYRRESCSLQSDPDTPYYVALAASIFGLESSGNHENTMNLKFDWEHNDRISEDQFNATNNLCLWTNLPHSIVSLNLSLCLCKQLNENPKDFLWTWLVCGALPLIGCLFVELSTVNALRDYEDFAEIVENNFCQQDWELQCGVIGVFLISLLKPMQDILTGKP